MLSDWDAFFLKRPKPTPGYDIVSDTQVLAFLMEQQDAIEDMALQEACQKVIEQDLKDLRSGAWKQWGFLKTPVEAPSRPAIDVDDRT